MTTTQSWYDSTGFFLWSYLKNSVYANNPTTLQELQMATTEQIAQIDTKMQKNCICKYD